MQKKLQVFISSTFSDLQLERQAAVAAILKSGHIPAGMELFTAGDKSQMDVIRRWIDESDVYMLVLGARYGSIESISNLSYTELEFDYAVSKEKPIFSVVIDESVVDSRVKEHGVSVIETDNKAKLIAFRKKVLSNISSFFKDAKDIKLAVYESLGDLSARDDLIGWVRASDVQDVAPYIEKIQDLENENRKLRVASTRQPESSEAAQANNFSRTWGILDSIVIKVPDYISGPPNHTAKLLDLFLLNQTRFVAGVTNAASGGENGRFLYYDIATKLKIHGLLEDRKLNGRSYECLATNKFGNDFLAWIDSIKLSAKQEDNSL